MSLVLSLEMCKLIDSYELQLSGLLQDLACSFLHLRDGG
jgi:hypothetical protein